MSTSGEDQDMEVVMRHISSKTRVSIPVRAFEGFQKLPLLGRGGSGVVRKYTCPDTNLSVALKEIPCIDDGLTKGIRREIDINKKLLHPNIVQFLGYCKIDDGFYILSEFMDGGSLQDKMKTVTPVAGRTALTENEIIKITHNLLCGLEFLHSNGILHRDIR